MSASFPPRPCRDCGSRRWAVKVVEVLASRKSGQTAPFAIVICGDCGIALYGCNCASPEVDYNPDKGELQCENCGQRWALDLPAGAVDLVRRAMAAIERTQPGAVPQSPAAARTAAVAGCTEQPETPPS